ncbi:MAG: hypothetical protein R3B91_13945 [Planctomycetaceae bacterium]
MSIGRVQVIEVFIDTSADLARRKLRSHAADNARVELEWSLVGLWSLLLYASDELSRQEIPLERLSLRAVCERSAKSARDYYHPAETSSTCDNDFADGSSTPTRGQTKPA